MSECADIYAAITRLETKIDSIQKIDEQSIINKISSLLKPEIAGAAAVGYVAQQKAGAAIGEAAKATGIANFLVNALGVIGGASGLLSLYGVTQVLPQRMDAIESYVDSVANDLSKALGQISGLSSRINSQDGKIGALEQKNRSQDSTLQDHAGKLRRHNDKLYEHTKQLEKHSDNLRRHNNKLYEHSKALERHNNKLYEHTKQLENHSSQLKDIPFIKYTISKLQDLISYQQKTIDSLFREIRDLNDLAGFTVAGFPIIQGNISDLGRRLTTTEIKATNLQDQINQIDRNPTTNNIDQAAATRIANAANATANKALEISNATNIKADVALSVSQQALRQPRTGLVVTPSTGITKSEAELTKYINTTVTKAVVTQSTGITAEQAKLEQKQQQQGRRITTLETNSKAQQNMNTEALAEIKKHTSKLENIGLGLAGLTVVAKGISSQTAPAAIQAAAAAGTCSTLKPGGCMSGLNTNAANAAVNSARNSGKLDGVNAALNTAELGLLKIMDNKLGTQITGGVSGGIGRLSNFLGIDRALNLLNFLANLHNASMLSASLKITLLEMVSGVGNATGLLQTSEGDNVDLNAVFNQGIETFIVSLIGAEAWASMKVGWRKYSSIYRAATNVLSNVGNMFSSIGNGIETIGEHTGKIGNALRAAGVVRENAYNHMAENMSVHTNKFMTFTTSVSGATEFVEAVNEVAESTIEGQEAYTEAVKATTEFKKLQTEAVRNPGIDNNAVKLEAEKIKANLVADPTGEDEEGLLSFLTEI